MDVTPVNLTEALGSYDDMYSPRIVAPARINGQWFEHTPPEERT